MPLVKKATSIDNLLHMHFRVLFGFAEKTREKRIAKKGIPNGISKNAGQSTVEAAFMIPVVFVAILLLVQPGIILYDRLVMRNAAAEGCRVLATTSADRIDACEEYILRRLGSIPSQSLFHEHESGCSWEITLEGNETTGFASVEITNKVKPIPLIGVGAAFLDLVDDQGFLTISVQEGCMVQPSWAQESALSDGAGEWAGAWAHG